MKQISKVREEFSPSWRTEMFLDLQNWMEEQLGEFYGLSVQDAGGQTRWYNDSLLSLKSMNLLKIN